MLVAQTKPPKNLGPALKALGKKGREYLSKVKGRPINHTDIAKAADYERGELKD